MTLVSIISSRCSGSRVEEVAVGADAGVRDDDVEAAEALDRRGRERLDLLRVADVAGSRQRAVDALVAAAARAQRDLAPAAASVLAVAAPMPLLAPVTSATRPSTVLTGPSRSAVVVGVRLRRRHVERRIALEEPDRLEHEARPS